MCGMFERFILLVSQPHKLCMRRKMWLRIMLAGKSENWHGTNFDKNSIPVSVWEALPVDCRATFFIGAVMTKAGC